MTCMHAYMHVRRACCGPLAYLSTPPCLPRLLPPPTILSLLAPPPLPTHCSAMTLRTADERATSTGARSTAHGHSHDHRRSLPAPGLFARLPVEVALQVAISGVLAPHDLRQLSQSCRGASAAVHDD